MNTNLSIMLAALLALGGNLLLTRSATERYQTSRANLQTVSDQVNGAQAKIDQLPALRAQQVSAEAHLTEIQQQFPAEENLASLVSHLQQLAAADHLQLSSIARTTQPGTLPGFQEVRLTVNLAGSYPNLYRYLSDLRQQKRLLNVTSFNSTNDKHVINVTGYTRH